VVGFYGCRLAGGHVYLLGPRQAVLN